MSKEAAGAHSTDDAVSDADLLDVIDDLGNHRPSGEFDDDDTVDDEDDEEEDEPAGDDDDGAADDDAGEDDEDEDDEEDEDEDEKPASTATPVEGTPAEKPATEAAITREDGATWNPTAARWQKDGKFVEGDPPAAPKAAEPAKDTAATGWSPFAVTVNREPVAIPEAQMSRANGHVILGIPDAKFAEFQSRIVKGVAAERNWRQLNDGIRQLEEERKALSEKPPVRSDAEVEADIILEVLKPQLAELLTPEQVENMALRVKVAQGEEQKKVGAWEAERTTKRQAEETERVAVVTELADMVSQIVSEDNGTLRPEYAHLDDAALHELMQNVVKHSKALVTKTGDKYERQHELAQYVVAQFAAAKKGSSTQGSPSAPAPVKDPTPAPAGTTGTAQEKTGDRAEKFNKAVDTAARPESTNLKERRTAGKGRPATRRTTGSPRGRSDGYRRTREQREEDDFRKLTRSYATSPTLDIGGDDDD